MKRRLEVRQELREIQEALSDLLPTLSPADWTKPTVHRDRDVKDLVAHLLDGSLRRLAVQRDGWEGETFDGRSFEELVAFIQRLNREWMKSARRLSPKQLVSMIAEADAALLALFDACNPDDAAPFAVAWAGEAASANWFDIAREYTEKWHHQQHIRDAVGRPDLTTRRHMRPVLETFVRALPWVYRDVVVPDDTNIQISITGDAAVPFCLKRIDGQWQLRTTIVDSPAAEIVLDGDVAWRLWTKSLPATDGPSRIAVHGDAALAAPALGMCCIMA